MSDQIYEGEQSTRGKWKFITPEPLSAEDVKALRQLRGDLAYFAANSIAHGPQKQLEAFDRLTGGKFK